MTNKDTPDSGSNAPKPASSASDLDQRLDALHKRLEKAQDFTSIQEDKPKPSNVAVGMALRIATEFVAGLVVGGMIGWQIDNLAGTRPWFMVVFLLLGTAAAMWNVIRQADRMQRASTARQDIAETGPTRSARDDTDPPDGGSKTEGPRPHDGGQGERERG